jgi:hypothetical protein
MEFSRSIWFGDFSDRSITPFKLVFLTDDNRILIGKFPFLRYNIYFSHAKMRTVFSSKTLSQNNVNQEKHLTSIITVSDGIVKQFF